MYYSNYDIFRYKAFTASKFYWDIGHGITLGGFTEVPPNTWVVFLSKPGHILHTEPFTTSKFKDIIKSTILTRSLALGTISKGELPGSRLHESSWKEHIYGPGDRLPNTYITFKPPETNSKFNEVMGVHDTSKPNQVAKYRNLAGPQLLNRVLIGKPGIHFIVTCRPTAKQAQQTNAIQHQLLINRLMGFSQNNNRMVPNLNHIISAIQRNNRARTQAQQVCRWNKSGYYQQCGIVLNPSLEGSRPTKKRILNPPGNGPASRPPFANGLFTFAPGVPKSLLPLPRYYPPRPRKPGKK